MEFFKQNNIAEKNVENPYLKYEKISGRYYHGSSHNVDNLKSTDETNNIRQGEEERRAFKDVVFLTNNFDKAVEYAGSKGVVYEVSAKAYHYKEIAVDKLNPKKDKSVDDDIFIALPSDIHIEKKLIKKDRKRGQSQEYDIHEH